jgi:hypothetical protein
MTQTCHQGGLESWPILKPQHLLMVLLCFAKLTELGYVRLPCLPYFPPLIVQNICKIHRPPSGKHPTTATSLNHSPTVTIQPSPILHLFSFAHQSHHGSKNDQFQQSPKSPVSLQGTVLCCLLKIFGAQQLFEWLRHTATAKVSVPSLADFTVATVGTVGTRSIESNHIASGNIAIENGPVEIVDLPINSMVIFQFVM